jgi:hypothetical protein
MEVFYTVVLIIAAITLVIFLSVFSVFIQKQSTSVAYPPSSLPCPDYWSESTNADGVKLCKPHVSLNTGSDITADNTPGLVTAGDDAGAINFADATWASKFMSSSKCAHHSWSRLHNVNWDGVSNFNSC